LQSYQLWMWKQGGIWHWSCLRELTEYEISPASGLRIHNTATTGHSSQYRMSGPLLSMSWKCYGHSSTGPCGCGKGIPLLCITSSLYTMTCLIIWMVWYKLCPWRRQNGRKTYSGLQSLPGRSWLNIILKWLQWLVCSSFCHISLIFSRSCDRLASGTSEWI